MTRLLLTDQEITAIFEGAAAPLVSAIGLHNLLSETRAIAQAQLAKALKLIEERGQGELGGIHIPEVVWQALKGGKIKKQGWI